MPAIRSTATTMLLIMATALAAPMPALAQESAVVLTDVQMTMDDGVTLVADIHLPPGTPTDGSVQVPCLVEMTPYRKEMRAGEGASLLPYKGFGLIEVDIRGTGGSEGEYDIVFSVREQWDGAEIIDWAAEESGLCLDKVGMYGGSYSGIIQYLVASLPPERASTHLAAIAPQRAYGDLYRDIVYHGGQLIGSFGLLWSGATSGLYTAPPTSIASPEGVTAWTDHLTKNDPMLMHYIQSPYIDGTYTSDDSATTFDQALYLDSSVLPRIENMRVPSLHLAGWFDAFTRGQLMTFQQAHALEVEDDTRGPNYLIVGPWSHSGTHFITPENFSDRLIDWYRHWLLDGPEPDWFGDERLTYYVMGEGTLDDDTGSWHTAESWPPPASNERWYLRGDGSLTPGSPDPELRTVQWTYDPSTGVSEFPSRWDNAVPAVPATAGDQRPDGERLGPTFLSPVYDEPLQFTGPISMRLFMATEGADGGSSSPLPDIFAGLTPSYHDTDIVVKISDVAPDGTTLLLTEGFLRASHRALDPQTEWLGDEVLVPFHPHTLESLDPPPSGEMREYWLEIWPTSKVLNPGHQLRVDVYSADTPNHLNVAKPSLNTIYMGPDAPSYLYLPMAAVGAGTTQVADPSADTQAPAAAAPSLPTTGGGAGVLAALLTFGGVSLRRRGRRRG